MSAVLQSTSLPDIPVSSDEICFKVYDYFDESLSEGRKSHEYTVILASIIFLNDVKLASEVAPMDWHSVGG